MAVCYIEAVFRFVTEALDLMAIRSACRSVRSGKIEAGLLERAEEMLARSDFFPAETRPVELEFSGSHEFGFPSAVATPWPENNVVYGKLYRAGRDWRDRPSVLLVHGWNGELGYWYQFPFLARVLTGGGINVAMIELPYHARRRPRQLGAINNFISHDLVRMLEATQQALSDLRAVLAWLEGQGSPMLGMWGISLGAWLTGLVAAMDARVQLAVLMSPVVSLDHAIRDLPFCAPIRESLGGRKFDLQKLNLVTHKPLCAPAGVLILESVQDLFAPVETVEQVWEAWGKPDIWRLAHGHISVLASVPAMWRTVSWIKEKIALLAIDRQPGKGIVYRST